MKLPVTVILAVKNEAANLEKCLASLRNIENIYVVDSHSEDSTCQIANVARAKVVQFTYKGGYPKKRQWALDTLTINTPWVLLLDADEIVPDSLWKEVREVVTNDVDKDAYLITKGFHFLGRRFRFGGFSHEAVLLFKKGKVKFEHLLDDPPSAPDMEIHERLIVDGNIGRLRAPLIHEDFKGLEAYIDRHNNYSTWDARVRYLHLNTRSEKKDGIKSKLFGDVQERRRFLKAIAIRIPLEPWLWFVFHYFIKLGFLEGRPGLIASQIRACYISQSRAKLYELQKNN